jgi:hypothetical protein
MAGLKETVADVISVFQDFVKTMVVHRGTPEAGQSRSDRQANERPTLVRYNPWKRLKSSQL